MCGSGSASTICAPVDQLSASLLYWIVVRGHNNTCIESLYECARPVGMGENSFLWPKIDECFVETDWSGDDKENWILSW